MCVYIVYDHCVVLSTRTLLYLLYILMQRGLTVGYTVDFRWRNRQESAGKTVILVNILTKFVAFLPFFSVKNLATSWG